MGNKIYIGNLSWSAEERDLQEAFKGFGSITEVKIVTDRDTGRSRGFAFVTFDSSTAADAAVEGMFEKEICGRPVKVSIAEERPRRQSNDRGGYRDNARNYRDSERY